MLVFWAIMTIIWRHCNDHMGPSVALIHWGPAVPILWQRTVPVRQAITYKNADLISTEPKGTSVFCKTQPILFKYKCAKYFIGVT